MTWDPKSLPRGEGKILLQTWGRSGELVLDNPRHRNAISPGMMGDLSDAVATLETWDGAAIVVRGAGALAFCAGGDLEGVKAHLLDRANGEGMCAFMTDLLDRLARLPFVVIAAVEGAALGGGAELLTACDLVIAGEGAQVGFVHAALGVSPGWGGGRRLREQVGPKRALQVLAWADRLDTTSALRLGVVDEVVPRGTAVARAQAHVDRLLSLPAPALQAAVAIARGASPAEEKDLFLGLWGGPAHVAALRRRDKTSPSEDP